MVIVPLSTLGVLVFQVYRQYGPPYVGVDPDIYYEYHTPKSGSSQNNYMWKTQTGACNKQCGTGRHCL